MEQLEVTITITVENNTYSSFPYFLIFDYKGGKKSTVPINMKTDIAKKNLFNQIRANAHVLFLKSISPFI